MPIADPGVAEHARVAPSKRAVEDDSTEADAHKKLCSAVDEMANIWSCPITLELPIDPVVAEDGRIYERHAIEEHIRVNSESLRSPITNEPMGPRLLTSFQVRDNIERLVGSGAITGDKADQWKQRMKEKNDKEKRRMIEEKMVKMILQKAKDGNVLAMARLARWYYYGAYVGEDEAKSLYWAQRGHLCSASSKGHAQCTAMLARHFISGRVNQNKANGWALMADAAFRGSTSAAIAFAHSYIEPAKFDKALPTDLILAKRWFERAKEFWEQEMAIENASAENNCSYLVVIEDGTDKFYIHDFAFDDCDCSNARKYIDRMLNTADWLIMIEEARPERPIPPPPP